MRGVLMIAEPASDAEAAPFDEPFVLRTPPCSCSSLARASARMGSAKRPRAVFTAGWIGGGWFVAGLATVSQSSPTSSLIAGGR
jgi:hypothetical protein